MGELSFGAQGTMSTIKAA